MLTLTRLDGSRFMVSRERIEFVEEDASDETAKITIKGQERGVWVRESFNKVQELLNGE